MGGGGGGGGGGRGGGGGERGEAGGGGGRPEREKKRKKGSTARSRGGELGNQATNPSLVFETRPDTGKDVQKAMDKALEITTAVSQDKQNSDLGKHF